MITFVTRPITGDVVEAIMSLSELILDDTHGLEHRLTQQARRGGMATVGEGADGKIVCSHVTSPLRAWSDADNPEVRLALMHHGVDPEKTTLGSYIYVHPDHQGRGLSFQMETERTAFWSDRGFTHALSYGAATPAIHGWFQKANDNMFDLGISDPFGRAVFLCPLEKIK